MPRAFAELMFTPAVKATQSRNGSREAYAAFERPEAAAHDRLGPKERSFIEARDGFYQATVNAHGWPYVQFRGGPEGFLRVLDERTLGFADFRGNRQYLSVGNLADDDRVALFLMDYARRRRLKIWGRARVIEITADAALAHSLAVPDYSGEVERAVLVTVAAFDWNCPQHITPRFTEAELAPTLRALVAERDALRQEVERLRGLVGKDTEGPNGAALPVARG
jgi:predicted pyridoxine 5'-phosphate oxidase superfamily flavin-nucleotide-binding protein